jgi:hypothetical protein
MARSWNFLIYGLTISFALHSGSIGAAVAKDRHSWHAKSIQWTLVAEHNQIWKMSRIDPLCDVQLVGDAASSGRTTAIRLTGDVEPKCVLSEQERTAIATGQVLTRTVSGSTISVAIIPLRQRGVNLVRVDQNFGGSSTIRRYAAVSIVHGNLVRRMLYLHELLPATIQSDASARRHSNSKKY